MYNLRFHVDCSYQRELYEEALSKRRGTWNLSDSVNCDFILDEYENIDWDLVMDHDVPAAAFFARKAVCRKAELARTVERAVASSRGRKGWIGEILAGFVPFSVVVDLMHRDPSLRGREALEQSLFEAEEEMGGEVEAGYEDGWGFGMVPLATSELEKVRLGGLEKRKRGRAWMLKPSLGRGGETVLVVRTIEDVRNAVLEWDQVGRWILQRYVERPLLVFQRKFHARMYVLVQARPLNTLRVSLYREGLLLIAPQKFDMSSTSTLSHITNTCFSVRAFRAAHKKHNTSRYVRLFSELPRILGSHPAVDHAYTGMRRALASLFASVSGRGGKFLAGNDRSYELFGVDFIIDQDLNPWLLEVNAGPDLKQTGHALSGFMSKMIEDLVCITLDRPVRTSWSLSLEDLPSPLPSLEESWGLLPDNLTSTSATSYLQAIGLPLRHETRFGLHPGGSVSAWSNYNGWDPILDTYAARPRASHHP